MVRVHRPSRAARAQGPLVTASCLAIAAAALAPQAARAADYPANDEASFKAAITAANADPSPSITLTADVSIADSATVPALTRAVTLNLGAFQLNNARFNSSAALSLTGSGQALLVGTSALGGNLTVTDSTLRLNSGATLTTAGLTSLSGSSTLRLSGAGSTLTTNEFRFGQSVGTTTVQIEDGAVFRSIYTGGAIQSLATIATAQVNLTITGAGSLMDVDGQLGISAPTPAAVTVNILNGGALTGGLRCGSGVPPRSSR